MVIHEKQPLTLNLLEQVYCSIEMKKVVSTAWKTLEIDDLVETLLYALYYLQEGKAIEKIISILTDLHTWYIFIFKYEKQKLSIFISLHSLMKI